MAQIELRNATLRVKDGYSAVAAIQGAGQNTGDNTLVIDGIVTVVPDLASFHIADDPTTYIVLSTTGSPTTGLTISPALVQDAANDAVITFGGRCIEIKIGEGNLTYNEQRTMEYKLDRGELDTVREGDDIPMEVAIDFVWEEITASSGDDPTFEDVLKNRGEASDWISSSDDACEPFAVDIEIEHEPPCGGEDWEITTLPDFRYESLNHNLRDATIAVAGKCNSREATVARVDPA